jgi:two-component system, chemotaxis family, chemotaxis protein CheY
VEVGNMPQLKCLIVDDDALGRELIIQYLEGVAECDTATNGHEAMELFTAALEKGLHYDLIILDLLMPEMNGYETGAAVRRLEKAHGIPVTSGVNIIVISSVNTPKEIIQSYASGQPAAHLTKPVSPDKLLKTLSALKLIP